MSTPSGYRSGAAATATLIPPPPAAAPGDPINDLTGDSRDAYAALTDLFTSYGLASLAPTIFNFIKQGYGADTITLLLQDTPEYKARFAGNVARQKAGLPVLSPADYLATEEAYRSTMQAAGLPATFYDSPSDFAAWIGGDVSATEVKDRVDAAVQDGLQAPDSVKQALQQFYGVGPNDITAYFLDQARSVPLIQIQAAAAQIGGAAIAHGLNPTAQTAEDLAKQGITAQQAQAGYGQISQTLSPLQAIAQRFGTDWTQSQAEQDVFNPGANAQGEDVTAKRTGLEAQEQALFKGNSGSISYVSLGSGSQQQ